MSEAMQKDTGPVVPVSNSGQVQQPAGAQDDRAAKKAEREAKKAAAREAEKAARKAAKEQAKADRAALKAQKKQANAERKLREKDMKALAKLAATERKAQEAQALKSETDAAAADVRLYDENIKKYGRMSTDDAEKAGNRLIETKPKLKLLRPKIGFKKWIETVCMIVYRTGNNYMRVAEAIDKDPSLKEMTLTDIYDVLGLVTRKRKNKNDDSGTGEEDGAGGEDDGSVDSQDDEESGDDDTGDDDLGAGDDDDAGESSGDTPKITARKPDMPVGSLTAHWYGGGYVIKLGRGWRESLHHALDDKNFEAILRGAGVVLQMENDDSGMAN